MRLTETVSTAISGLTARLRQNAIVYGLCAVCAVAAIILAISASVLALEPYVGAVYARLIVGGVFVAIALIAIASLKFIRPRPFVATTPPGERDEPAQPHAQSTPLAMIVEAMMLGYTLSSRRSHRGRH